MRLLQIITDALPACNLQHSDRKIFINGLILFTAVTSVAGLFGLFIVSRDEVASVQRSLWHSLHASGDLIRNSVNTAVSRSKEIVLLSRLGPLLASNAPAPEVLQELQRIRAIADYGDITSINVSDAYDQPRAHLGTGAFAGQFSVQLPATGGASVQLFWSSGWHLRIRIPLAAGTPRSAHAIVEVKLNKVDQAIAQLAAQGASSELRICARDGGKMRCFPSRLLHQDSTFSIAPAAQPLIMSYALNGAEGVTTQHDYRDKEVVAAFGHIDSLGLGLVQKVDADEAYQPMGRKLAYGVTILLAMIIVGAWLIYWRMRPLVSGLAQAHARLDVILNNIPAGVVLLDRHNAIVSANRAAATLFQREPGDVHGTHIGQLLADSGDSYKVEAGTQERLIVLPCGTRLWLQITATELLHDNASTRIMILQDVSERKNMESMLDKWGHVFRHAEWGMATASPDGSSVEMVNPAFARMYGYSPDELAGTAVRDLLAPEARAGLGDRVQMANAAGSFNYESLHQCKDGTTFPVWVNLNLVTDERGIPLYHAVSVIDISARKRLEQDLRQNELLLRQILEALPVGIWVTDGQGHIAIANPASQLIWGSAIPGQSCAHDSPGRCRLHWHSADAEPDESAMMLAVRQGRQLLDDIVTLEGSHGVCKTIRYSVVPLGHGATGQPTALVVSEDISQSRQAELALRRSEASLAKAQRLAHIGSWERDIASGKQYWSDEMFRICGMPLHTAPPDFLAELEFIAADERPQVRQLAEQASAGQTPYDITYRVVLPDGSRKVLNARAQLEFDAAGNPVRLLGTLQDITEKKRAEELLRKREEEFRALVENSPDVILRVDAQDRCVYVNPAIKAATGLAPCRLIGRKFSDLPLFAPITAQTHAAIDWVFATASNETVEFSVMARSGTRHYQVMLVPEFGQEGKVMTVLAMARDISAIKRDAQALRRSRQLLRDLSAHLEQVREEERKAIAREVHDELGQALTALRMDLSLLRLHHAENNPVLLKRIELMKEGIDSTIHIVRHISSALRPVALDLGLSAALEWLVEDFRRRSGIDCRLHAGASEVILSDGKATALFRIVQESLTNVLKHAGATAVEILLQIENELVRLEIRDNGRGFSTARPAQLRSFGLVGMCERALKLGGTVEIESAPGSGTRVLVGLPLADAPARQALEDYHDD